MEEITFTAKLRKLSQKAYGITINKDILEAKEIQKGDLLTIKLLSKTSLKTSSPKVQQETHLTPPKKTKLIKSNLGNRTFGLHTPKINYGDTKE